MRNLLALAAVVIIILAVVGYYQGWYTFKDTPAPDGHHNITLDVDGNKIKEDINKVEEKVGGVLQKKS